MPQQSQMQFTLVMEGGPAWEVVKFTLAEALSQPFRLEVDLASLSASVDFDALLDTPATFTIHRDGVPVRVVQGILTGLEQGQTGFRRTRYKAVIEPALVRLSLRQNSRIFQRKAVPDILKTLLTEQRVAERQFDLVGAHLSREYCVQHRESDARFFDRLAAEEGLVYYFEPNQASRLMLSDAIANGPTLGGGQEPAEVPYQPAPGGDAAAPRLWHFAYRQQLAPTRVVQRDYTFKNPPYDLQQQAQAREGIGEYEHYESPGRYKQDEAGKPFTATRLAALRREARTATIEGDDARLWPGLSFALADHPNADLNTDWRVVSMAHEGEQSASQEQDGAGADTGSRYRYTAQVVPAQSDWKPAPPPRPVMDGPQIAHVVGPPGEEIHVDEHGRVMVWFPWDRAGKREDSTCWLRVSQGWAGASYGMVALPRIGHEVIVDFLEGDPDQPLVTGRSYHAANRPPNALPGLKTLTSLKSQEHKGGGHNELLIDDTTGQVKAQLKSTHAATQLNLGYLTHPRSSEGAGEPRGEGFELRTDASGALRAAKGLLVTAYERAEAGSGHLDQAELTQCVKALTEMVKSLTDTAAEHQATPARHEPRTALAEAVERLGAGANDRQNDTGAKPIVALNAPEGVVVATPKTVLVVANQTIELAAQASQSLTAAEQVVVTAGKGISQFAYTGGVKIIAHQDTLDLQAQHGEAHVQALKAVRLSAVEGHITLNAKERLTLLCGGAYITLSEGNIEIGCPGELTVKAKTKYVGSASASEAMNGWEKAQFDERFIVRDEITDEPLRNALMELIRGDGTKLQLTTDSEGRLPKQRSEASERITLRPIRATPSQQKG